jgi:hypothetical protein
MKKRFDGTYYKHQKGENSISFIAGVSHDHAFIQVITNQESYYFRYPLSAYEAGKKLKIGDCIFSPKGVKINIKDKNIAIKGKIKYSHLTPLPYDIMGPFRFLSMQCSHRIISLHHKLEGSLKINETQIDFSDGTGYMEGDFGTSFPKEYIWIQSNDFPEKMSIMATVADIPLAGSSFRGCLCVVYHHGVAYRLATYLGVKIIACTEHQIILQQGKLRLEIMIEPGAGHKLIAPQDGKMTREIHERIECRARFRFMVAGKPMLDEWTDKASFEAVKAKKS